MNTSNNNYTTQNELLLNNLLDFYKTNDNLNKMLIIVIEINKELYKLSSVSLGKSSSELTSSCEFSETI